MRIGVLGAYGNAGRALARLVTEHLSVDLRLIGRDPARLAHLCQELDSSRVDCRLVGHDHAEGLGPALDGLDWLVCAASMADELPALAEQTAQAGLDWYDIGLTSAAKLRALREIAARHPTRTFITDGGFHPGIPGAMIRWAADEDHTVHSAWVCAVLRPDWSHYKFSKDTAFEFAREIVDFRCEAWVGDRWQKVGMKTRQVHDPKLGHASCLPWFLHEMAVACREARCLTDAGFAVSGFDAWTDMVVLPCSLGLLKVFGMRARNLVGRWFLGSVQAGAKPPYGSALHLKADGSTRALGMRVYHDDAYFLTAAPVVATFQQLLGGLPCASGVHFQACVPEPHRFFADLASLGVTVEFD